MVVGRGRELQRSKRIVGEGKSQCTTAAAIVGSQPTKWIWVGRANRG